MAPLSPRNSSASCTTWGSLFSLEMEENPAGKENKREAGAALEKEHALQLSNQILQHLQHTQFSARLSRDVMCMKNAIIRENAEESSGVCVVHLASKLANVGYNVSVRMALGSGGERSSPKSSPKGNKDNLHYHHRPNNCFRHLRHEFLLVRGHDQGEYEGLEYVVDLAFRDQFEIPHPTLCYQELLKAVPQVFVGPFTKLVPIVHIICSEMASSFTVKGQTLPPWRKTEAILSKWMPQKLKDTPLTPKDSSPGPSIPTTQLNSRHQQQGSSTPTLIPRHQLQGRALVEDEARVLKASCSPARCSKMVQGFHVGGLPSPSPSPSLRALPRF